jgi:BirA family biotin operon repressor/biotin-[acetyl-CoA-carboxylase] ligase
VLGTVLAQLAQVLAVFEAGGFAPLKREWSARHACQDRAVTLHLPDGSALAGTVSGVEDDGSLLLRTASGVRRLFGGEISLRAGA